MAIEMARSTARLAAFRLVEAIQPGARRVGRAHRCSGPTAQPLVVLLVDIDDFKAVNDTYGHGTGGRGPGTRRAALSAGTRPTDMVARLRGDEFVTLLDKFDAAACTSCEEPPEAFAQVERAGAAQDAAKALGGASIEVAASR